MGKSSMKATINSDLFQHQSSWVEPRGLYFSEAPWKVPTCSHLRIHWIKPGMPSSGCIWNLPGSMKATLKFKPHPQRFWFNWSRARPGTGICWGLPEVYFSLVAQTVKRLPATRETRVQFLGREDPLEKEMAIHSRTLAWKIPWTEEPDRLRGFLKRVRNTVSR